MSLGKKLSKLRADGNISDEEYQALKVALKKKVILFRTNDGWTNSHTFSGNTLEEAVYDARKQMLEEYGNYCRKKPASKKLGSYIDEKSCMYAAEGRDTCTWYIIEGE